MAGSVAGSALAYVFVVLWKALALNPDGTVFFPINLPLSLILITYIPALSLSLPAAFK